MAEVHEGICGNHLGGRTLAHKILNAGYYWPKMHEDAKKYVKKCHKCQRFALIPRQPPEDLNPVRSPWPFYQWGLDIVGPLPTAPRQK